MNGKGTILTASVLALAACGRQADLQPAPGHNLPVKPMMARATPTVRELLTPSTQARPNRVDELVKKSQPRPSDPFDLPPPTGGNAPSLPAGSDPSTVPTNTTSTNPGD